jgi:enoyl-CoA hydratase/carnithine racemase
MTDKMLARRDGHIGTLIFNNPARHNAVSFDMWEAAERILDDFEADPEVRVIVLTGAGVKAFVSGADISKFEDERAAEDAVRRYNAQVERIYARIYTMPKPTIAKIRGYCIGGGLNLAICCDLRFATRGSRFGLPAARLGLGYGYPGLRRYIQTLGPAVTKEIFFTARQFSADEALAWGVVNRVVGDEELDEVVRTTAEAIAQNAPLTIRCIKLAATEALRDPEDRDLDACEAAVQACFNSEDYVEGRRAFLEKRKPVFQGK